MPTRNIELDSTPSLEALGQSLDDLPTQGHLYEDDVSSPTDSRRVRISRTYLWLLGYLKKDNEKQEPDDDYRSALERFQRDIRVPVTGQSDEQTWKALKQLAPYDTPTSVGRWFRRDGLSPAFKRAVHLRLFSYGLLKDAPTHKELSGRKLRRAEKAFQAGLEDFARVASSLGYVSEPLTPSLNSALLRLLFDHNAMTRRLRPGNEGFKQFTPHPDLPLEARKRKKLLKTFIGNLALVELWLIGYEVRPGNFKADGPHATNSSGTLNQALTKFASDRSIDLPSHQSITVGAWFFKEARRIHQQPDNADEVDDQKLRELATDRKRLTKLEKTYESLGARILDGVKRAVKWVFDWFRRAFRVLKQLLRNLARAVHRGALAAYRRIRAVVRSFGVAFGYFFGPVIKGSDLQTVYVRKKADFDMEVFINDQAPTAEIGDFFDSLNLRIRAMELVGAIIGKLLALLRFVSKLTGPVVGWLRLVLSLARLANWLRRMRELVRETTALIERLDELEARGTQGREGHATA